MASKNSEKTNVAADVVENDADNETNNTRRHLEIINLINLKFEKLECSIQALFSHQNEKIDLLYSELQQIKTKLSNINEKKGDNFKSLVESVCELKV